MWFKRYEPTDLRSLGVLLGVLPALPVALLRAPLSSTPFAVLVSYASFYAALLLSITAYRLSPFHPLYKYPGPLLGRLTNFRGMFIAAGGKQHLYFKKMHDKYGPIVRLGMSILLFHTECRCLPSAAGPNVLSIVDVDLLPTLLGADGMPKGPSESGSYLVELSRSSTHYAQCGRAVASRASAARALPGSRRAT